MTKQEEFEKEAKAVGERLAMLLFAAHLPDDVKEGFAAMIPEMNPEQIDRLMKILEANVADSAATQEAKLGESLQAAQEAYEQKRQAVEKKAMSELNEIEKVLHAE